MEIQTIDPARPITQEEFDFFWCEVQNYPNQLDYSKKFKDLSLDDVNLPDNWPVKSFIRQWTEKWTHENNIKDPLDEVIKEVKTELKTEEIKFIASYDMNSKLEGTRVKTRGMVYRVADIFNETYQDVYYCAECQEEFTVEHSVPTRRCVKCGADAPRKKKELSRDFKELEIEELPEEIIKQPEKIKIRAYEPLIYSEDMKVLQPGEIISITGIINKEKIKVKNNRDIHEYYIVLENLELENKKETVDNVNEDDMQKIIEISKDNPLDKLAKSLAPGIYDMEPIKKSIVLQMVRGPEGNDELRPRIHVLLVGEAGVAKSQLARQAHKKMPRSIYGSGDNMSKAGLATSMEKEEMTGRWIARAGILCRANKSLVVLDEFDKLKKEDMEGLHNPMEHGESTTTKAGAHINLKSDCSILACCNPKNGTFLDVSGYESIASQVNIPIPILNRFDLIFLLRDIVNEDKDRNIIKSMFNKKAVQEISNDLFKKYISFALKINPEIPKEIAETIEEIYIKLRKSSITAKETKINPRISRAISSLAVASAKIRLSSEVTIDDVHIAESLMMDSFESMGFGRSLNSLDQASLYTKTTSKKLSIQSKIREIIKKNIDECKEKSVRADWDNIKPKILELGYAEREIDSTFNILKREGTLRGEDYKLIWS